MLSKTITSKKVSPVTVETKKIDKECCGSSMGQHCCHGWKILKLALILINTILLCIVLVNQRHIEEMKVGGPENYQLLKTLFNSDGFKNYQKAQIEQTMQMLKSASAAQNAGTTSQQAAQPQAAQAQPATPQQAQ
jgi:hypothetical protein